VNGPRIAILGDGIEAWLFAALFRQLSRRAGTLLVVPMPHRQAAERIALPPVVESAHRLLRIAPASLAPFGWPRYGVHIAAPGGREVLIPYGGYGEPKEPGNLVDAWIRLESEGRAPALAGLSANAALMTGGRPGPNSDPRLLRSISAGWEVDAGRYGAVLKDAALARGTHAAIGDDPLMETPSLLRLADGTVLEADLVVDASESIIASGNRAGWHGHVLRVGTSAQRLDDAEPFAIAAVLSGAARLASLLPRPDAKPLLAREYNRLLAVELAGMEAASAMLARLAGREGPSVTLDRYEARYRFAGLLPADPQPWTRDMWLSAFDAMGWRPGRYDPNLDRFDTDRSAQRFDDWKALIDRDLARRA